MTRSEGVRPWRLGLSALQILLPAALVLGGLYIFGQLRLGPALLAALLALIISAALATLRERRLLMTRRYLSDLADGRAPAAPLGFGPLIDNGLDLSLWRLASALDERRRRAQAADQVLNTLLDAMPDPILVVDGERTVVRVNAAAHAAFPGGPSDKPLEASLRDPGLLGAVDGALRRQGRAMPEHEQQAQLTLHLPGPAPRAFGAQVLPIELGGEGAAVISLRELTEQLMIERMRSDFIANASHEIRTPLASLLGFIETLQGPAHDDPAAQARFLEIMGAEARRMSRLVDDLLSLSRIEMNAHQAPTERVDLIECARTVVGNLETYAAQRKVSLAMHESATLPDVRGDRDQLMQLLTNLIDNGIKYGGAETVVMVTLEALGAAPPAAGPLTGRAAVRIEVRDQGPGIAREHLPRVTERFFRVDPARSRALGGTGLGLAIVKHILRRHRGHLTIESELGRGTTVSAFLPVA